MVGSRLDRLAKTFAAPGSRRQAFGGLLIASLALLGGTQAEETDAAKSVKQCKKIDNKQKRKQCLKKAKQQPTQTPTETTPLGPLPAPPPPPACDAICQGNARVNECLVSVESVCPDCAGSASPRCVWCVPRHRDCCQDAYYSWDAYNACMAGAA